MKNTGFRQLTYEEALEKQKEYDERKRSKPQSQASKAWKKRSNQKKYRAEKQETEWKRQVRLRDKYKCQFPGCKYKDAYIHCHHIAPRSQRRDLIYVVSNGVCVCADHHDWIHQHPIQAVELGLLSKETREWANKEDDVLPFPGED